MYARGEIYMISNPIMVCNINRLETVGQGTALQSGEGLIRR